MNAADLRSAVDRAMQTNDRIDSIETRQILEAILADGVSPEESAAVKALMDDCWNDVYNARESLRFAGIELDLAGADKTSERYAKAVEGEKSARRAFNSAVNKLNGVGVIEKQVKLQAPKSPSL